MNRVFLHLTDEGKLNSHSLAHTPLGQGSDDLHGRRTDRQKEERDGRRQTDGRGGKREE